MPSPDAVLGTASIPEMASTYDGLGMDMEDFDITSRGMRIPNYTRMMTGREFTSMIGMLSLLGIEANKNSDIMRALRIMLMTNMTIFGIYRMVIAIRRMDQQRQMMISGIETAACANPLLAWKIPIAVGAAFAVAAAFSVGMAIGAGDWKLPHADVKSASGRRMAERNFRGLR